QKLLGLDIVSQYHGKESALEAQQTAVKMVLQGDMSQTEAVPEFSLASVEFPAKLFYIVSASGLCKSSSEARKKIAGGAVRLDDDRISDQNLTFDSPAELDGKVLRVGKKNFVRLVKN
ncbi:S4 domain-containing protein, partial [Hydrocoleum sp. CS-953]|uniref:S4 domain-containing protein n=2 Tax=Microcoleaceae TaxID=1892252 RepID=UPI00352B3B6D